MSERLLVLPPIYGTWTIKISGSGFEGVGALVYSGMAILKERATKLDFQIKELYQLSNNMV